MNLIEHHIKYKEIHGKDVTVWLSRSEHSKLHRRLRKENKCKISVPELLIIAQKAGRRTDRAKRYNKEYRYMNIYSFDFYNNLAKNVQHHEQIFYNNNNGGCVVNCRFKGTNGKKLFYVDIT
ncbi:MAG: hypothetical protein KKG99_12420 [Bacteroidetes bacterium]|nr:hypothetical protein [Bacteroidota bacterium]